MDIQLLVFPPRSYSTSFAKFKLLFDSLEAELEGDRGQLKCHTSAVSCRTGRNLCRVVAVVQLLIFPFKKKKRKEYLQHWPAQCTRKRTIREKGEITHFILSSSCSHGCLREAVICPEIFMSQCVVFALPGASLCKEPDCIRQAPCARVRGPRAQHRAQHMWRDKTASKWFSGIKSEELHIRLLPAMCKTLTQAWCSK